MSSIITGILSSTVGLLANKVRDSAAANLMDGGVTDRKIREFVVRELNDIKTKLDALSLKELKYSYVGLKEGVNFVYVYLYNSNELDQEAVTDSTQGDCVDVSRMQGGVESHFLNKALELSDAMKMMKYKSGEEFETAKKRFEVARVKAGEAFCNDALSIDDKIFAAKVRVVSEILEHLDNPQIAITGCFSFLDDLHKLPAIRDIFTAYIKGTSKSLFAKDERIEAIKSVMLINYVLYRFNLKFSNRKLSADRFIWPATIELNYGRHFNPILDWREIATRKSMGDELSRLDDHWELTRSFVESVISGHDNVEENVE